MSQRQRGRPRAFNDKTEQNTVQSLDRAIDVLELLGRSNGLSLSEVAEELGQSAATVYRVLITCETRGLTELNKGDQTWHIGASAFRLGTAFLRRSSVVERARPFMHRLVEDTGETANLGVEREGQVLFLSQVETQETIRAFFPPGTRSPMHASGIGKALLSLYPEDRLARVLRNERESFTRKTITSEQSLRRDLDRIRDRGYALDDEEKTEGMRCIAAAIRDVHGEPVAGISISGPSHRIELHKVSQIGALVSEAANALSAALGAPD